MTLITQIFDGPDKNSQLLLLTDGFSFSTGEHGFRSWQADLDVGFERAQEIYNWPGVPHVEVVDEAATVVWQGRLEDIAIRGGEVELAAFGYWRALTDVPYTALWSKTGSGGWRAVSKDDNSQYSPTKYNVDNNNRIYISLKKNQTYANNSERGGAAYLLPHGGERALVQISYSYDVKLPTDVRMRIVSFDEGFSGGSVDRTIIGNGASQTGTETITLSANKEIVVADVTNTTGAPYPNNDEDDAWYVKLTSIRITTQTPDVLASDIAAALATYVNGVNADQLSASDALIEATTTDLNDELYEDELAADILDRLALLHGYEAGVWEGQRLHFRKKGSQGRAWLLNVRGVLEAQRSLDNVANSIYAAYRDANNRTLRTSVSGDTPSQERFNIVRRDVVDVRTTSQTEAEAHRDAALSDRAGNVPRISLEVESLQDENGGEWPFYHMRAGDTVTFRDLLPYALSTDDEMSTFIVGETEYNADENTLTLASEEPLPTLVTLIARREAGIRS